MWKFYVTFYLAVEVVSILVENIAVGFEWLLCSGVGRSELSQVVYIKLHISCRHKLGL